MSKKELEVLIRELPENLKKVVSDYVEQLLSKYYEESKARSKFKFDWEGELSQIRDEFTSVELQHKALELR